MPLLLPLLLLLAGKAAGLPARIHVGGLFEAEDEEQETCFRVAVDWLNVDEDVLRNSRIVSLVERLHSDDAFRATRRCCALLQRGVAAVFGPRSKMGSLHVRSVCDGLEVPHVESRWQHRLQRDQLSVNLYPHPDMLSKAFVHLVTVTGWTEFFLLYQEDEAIVRLKDFFVEGEKRGWTIMLYQVRPESTYRETLWEMKKTKRKEGPDAEYKIVLDVPGENLYEALKSAQQVGMMTENQKYLITSLDMHTIDMEEFQFSRTNITGLRLVQEESPTFQRLLEEVNHRLARRRGQPPLRTLQTESALMFDSVRLLAMALESMDQAKNIVAFPAVSCSLMNKGTDGTSLVNYMKSSKMKGVSGSVEFDSEGFRSAVSFDIMHVTTEGVKKIGTLLSDDKLRKTTEKVASKFAYVEMRDNHYKVTTVLRDPYVMLKHSPGPLKGNDRFEGYCIDLLDSLTQELHFSYEIDEVEDQQYGKFNASTGLWNGMIGEVVAGRADMAIADLTINTYRMQGVDFTLPFVQTGISILFTKPTQKVTSLFSFLSPFSGELWLLVMAAYTFVSLTYFLVGRMSQYEWMSPHPCRRDDAVEENVFGLLNSMWFAIGTFLQQGCDIVPTAMSTRAITSIWYFFGLIVVASYTANLAAFLTVESIVPLIESVEDLAAQEAIKYGALDSGSTKVFFQTANVSTYQRMWRFMEKYKEDVIMERNEDAIERVKRGGYAFLMEEISIEYLTERNCNLTQVGGRLDFKGFGIAIKKDNDTLRSWLSGGILRLQDRGELAVFKERWWKEKRGGGGCTVAPSAGVNELGMANVGGVFVVMMLGLLLALVVAVLEFLWFQRRVQREPETSLFKLLMREIGYAVQCGSSTKPAPKLKGE